MTEQEALAILLDIASRWGENAEEGFARRVTVDDTDQKCQDNADLSGAMLDEVTEVRDLWRAVKLLAPTKGH